jgi:addiction module HigA family antidote
MLKRDVHPGAILKDEFNGLGITPTAFARRIDVPPNRMGQIIGGKCGITGDTALRLGQWFGVDPQVWLNLQCQFDLAVA